jgi:hypothetical protein
LDGIRKQGEAAAGALIGFVAASGMECYDVAEQCDEEELKKKAGIADQKASRLSS